MYTQNILNRARFSVARQYRGQLVAICTAVIALIAQSFDASASHDQIRSVPLGEYSSSDAGTSFELVSAAQSGIEFANKWEPPKQYESVVDRSFAGGGVAIGDYDSDGLLDVYLTRPFGGGRLYKNRGNFRFSDVTKDTRLAVDQSWSCGAAFTDIDGDSDLDLFVCGYDCPNRMFINQGDGTFVDRAHELGLDFHGASVMMAFADYDNDGDVDGFLVTNRFAEDSPYAGTSLSTIRQVRSKLIRRNGTLTFPESVLELFDVIPGPEGMGKIIKAGQFAKLYRNDGKSGFTEVSKDVGIVDNGMSLSATWWDFNADGWPDLYVSNDFFGADRLYRNNTDGTFTDVLAETFPHSPWYSMGTDAADINNDGRLDLIATDMSGTTHYKQKLGMGDMSETAWFLDTAEPRQYMRNSVYVNTGTGPFLEVAQMCGLANTDWTWSPTFGDFDNDGKVDLMVTNGMTGDWFNSDLRAKVGPHESIATDQTSEKRDRNLLFRNLGDLRFEEVGSEWGVGDESVSFGSAIADLDGDGDLDLIVNNFNQEASVYRNNQQLNNRAIVRLKGITSCTQGLGATVHIRTADGLQVRYLTSTHGFMGSSPPEAHFGLGTTGKIESLEVTWPSGNVQTFQDLAANHLFVITENTKVEKSRSERPSQLVLFEKAEGLDHIVHREKPFDDFARQPLLPNRLSQLGPCLAVGDVNGDGTNDLFLGGGAGRGGELHLMQDGSFELQGDRNELAEIFGDAPEPFHSHYLSEDVAAEFFDADGDGDDDLYVVSGGIECEPGDEVLRDRLYLNDGEANFSYASDAIPDLRDSGGCVATADFDGDGDLDIFVGGRSIPGRYPEASSSRLLRNEGGNFVDVTSTVSEPLAQCGMVTDASWADVDADGWVDLVLTCDWGPVRVFRNDGRTLIEQTDAAGLADRLGWWTKITPGDLNRDGDVDFVVTNFGANTKYHPTANHPVKIFYGDMDGSGTAHIIEAKHMDDSTLLPVRGKSCSQAACPLVGEKFPTYHEFATATLGDIYTNTRLSQALSLSCNCLNSGVLINDGRGVFEFRPLPREAQVAPSFGAALLDFNRDGAVDIYLIHNFYGPQRETGRMNGGVGLLLKGNGDGSFTSVEPVVSGLVVAADAKSVVACDIDGDGWKDLVVGINDGPLQGFLRHSSHQIGSVKQGQHRK